MKGKGGKRKEERKDEWRGDEPETVEGKMEMEEGKKCKPRQRKNLIEKRKEKKED